MVRRIVSQTTPSLILIDAKEMITVELHIACGADVIDSPHTPVVFNACPRIGENVWISEAAAHELMLDACRRCNLADLSGYVYQHGMGEKLTLCFDSCIEVVDVLHDCTEPNYPVTHVFIAEGKNYSDNGKSFTKEELEKIKQNTLDYLFREDEYNGVMDEVLAR